MATNKATHQMNRGKVPAVVKTTLAALALVAACIAGINLTESSGPAMHGVATASPQSFASTAANGLNAPDHRMSNEDFLSSNLNDKISSPISGPRECRPEQGIVNDCTFQ